MAAPRHYIRRIKTTSIPNRFIYLDSEAHETNDGFTKVQTFRLAVTCRESWSKDRHDWAKADWVVHHDPGELWDYIDGSCLSAGRTVVVAHNLGYDLRITEALRHILPKGWINHRQSISGTNISFHFRRGGQSLVLTDSMSYFNMSLEKVAGLMATEKVPLPAFTVSDDEWMNRCRTDVEILRAACHDVWAWIRDDDLGWWQRTGPSMAWANWRHMFKPYGVESHEITEIKDIEGQSCYTGRCEAWRHGHLKRNEYTDWDLPLAYPSVCRDIELPGNFYTCTTPKYYSKTFPYVRGRRALWHAECSTSVPVLPWHDEPGFVWPVGEFRGWWWDDEIALALDHGAEVIPDKVILYNKSDLLKGWAEWITNYITNGTETSTPIRQAVAKHWSRALVGRFAMQYQPWESQGAAFEHDYETHPIVNYDTGETGTILTLGDERFVAWSKVWGADTIPAVVSAVMSECRIRLFKLMCVAGLDHVAYCDTDSLTTDREGSKRLYELIRGGEGWGVRPKQHFVNLTIKGPRHRLTEGMPAISGIPKGATSIGEDKWAAETWESFATSLKNSRPNAVVISMHEFKARGVDNRREHLPDGRTAPMEIHDSSKPDLPRSVAR
jgi:hypothetical protein